MPKETELKLQIKIITLLRKSGFLVFSVPNGIFVPNPKTREDLIKSGLLAGVSDLVIVCQSGKTFFVELKTKTGVQSERQKWFQKEIGELGHKYLIWKSKEDCSEWINKQKW